MIYLIFTRDVKLAFRRGGGAFAALAFCLMVFAVFAFSLGPVALHEHAARIAAVAVLLSCLLSLPNLFERDAEDGTLEQYMLSGTTLEWLVLAKLAAFWVASALPLILLAPLLALMGGLPGEAATQLAWALLLATPALCAVGALGAALTRGGITQALVVLPLFIPPLIFVAEAGRGGAYALLFGMSLIAVPLACLVCTALLRFSYD